MGLDDSVADSGIIKYIEKHMQDFVLIYSDKNELTEENLNKWETMQCYTGYSVAFHTLYPLYRNICLDGIVLNPTEHDYEKIRKYVRNRILNIINTINKQI